MMRECAAYVLMLQMLEQLQLSVCSLRQDWCAERLHYLLHSNRLSCELILGRATGSLVHNLSIVESASSRLRTIRVRKLPCPLAADRYICAGQSLFPRLCRLPRRCLRSSLATNLLVISNVVPKIWARTNSAMVKDVSRSMCRCGRWCFRGLGYS